MEDSELEIFNRTDDPVLLEQKGYVLDEKIIDDDKKPKKFTGIKKKTIKAVSLYIQLLWSDSSNGKTIDIQELILNSRTLFGTRFESEDKFVIRHIASDLREVALFCSNIKIGIKKYYKNINTEREDISKRLDLNDEIVQFFSEIVHFNYLASYEKAKLISPLVNDLDRETSYIPDKFEEYNDSKNFERIFENFCITFVLNIYKIFSEFLFDEKI